LVAVTVVFLVVVASAYWVALVVEVLVAQPILGASV
jgi:hypothetical protein